MLNALNDAKVDYLLVGAYAMAAHGCPRATGDIDFWVCSSPENSKRVWTALEAFGAPLTKMSISDFCTPDVVYQIGVPPQRIDLLTSISGIDFDVAWLSRVTIEIDGIFVPVIGARDLYINKVAAGRPKDVPDIETLRSILGI